MSLSEQEMIQRYFAPLAGPEGLGLIDDVALLPQQAGFDLVVNTDMISEGVHFLDDPPAAIAAKALRVNLSDLAAKGADAFGYVLALGLSEACDERWLADFAGGLAADQQRYGVRLIGGDTNVVDGATTIGVTVFGKLPSGTLVRRHGARPGDIVLVSGTIGDAALGLLVRSGQVSAADPATTDPLVRRYLYPEPQMAMAAVLRRHATASMDISDGLVGDLAKLCAASQIGAEIKIDQVPLSDQARTLAGNDSTLMEPILTGGDDYEILATVAPDSVGSFTAASTESGVTMTPIGRISGVGAMEPTFRDSGGRAVNFRQKAFDHFARRARS